MNKWKKLVAVATAGLALGTSYTPIAQAESITYSQFGEQVKDVHLQIDSVHVKGQLDVSTTGGSQELAIQGMLDALVDIANLNTSGKASAVAQGQTFNLEWAIKDNQLVYSLLGAPFETQDITEYKAQFKQGLTQGFEQALIEQTKLMAEYTKYAPLFDDLFDVEMTDTEYVLSLKQNIDGKAYFEKHEALLKEFKQFLVEKIRENQEVTADQERLFTELDQHFTADNFAKLASINPTYVIHYAKDSLNPLSIEFTAVIKLKELTSQAGAEAPDQISVKYSMTFDQYNQPLDIKLPATNQ